MPLFQLGRSESGADDNQCQTAGSFERGARPMAYSAWQRLNLTAALRQYLPIIAIPVVAHRRSCASAVGSPLVEPERTRFAQPEFFAF